MALEKKTLFCFCHWGGKKEVNSDGSISYKDGITDHVIVNSGTTYEEFLNTVFHRLGIEPSGKVLHYSVKFDKSQLIRLKDQSGVDALIQFNDDSAHIYVSNCEMEVVVAPVMDSTRGSTTEVEAQQTQLSEERHVSGVHSALIPVTNFCKDVRPVTKLSKDVRPVTKLSKDVRPVTKLSKDVTSPLSTLSKDVTSPATAKWGELLLGEGQAFVNADAFREAVHKYAFAKQFHCKFVDNAAKYMRVKCAVNGCKWKVSAASEKTTDRVSIRKFNDSHVHSPLDETNFKPRFNAKVIRDMIPAKILDSPGSLPREVRDETQRNFGIELTYKQAWMVKKKARLEIEGKMEDSFKLIPWLCTRLTEAMPGTIAMWSCTDDNRFKQLFVSYECSIRGFHVGCRPLIFINVYRLSDAFRSTLLSASALDGNNEPYPLAYSVITSENEEDWLWFLEHLKLVIRDREVVIVSDMNPTILLGVEKIFGEENCAHCFHCVLQNFRKFADTNRDFRLHGKGKEVALGYLNDTAYARTMEMYNEALIKMSTFRKELYEWVISNGPEHWSNALFKKPRWDWLNLDVADFFDALLGEDKVLQIPEMMEAYRDKLSQILQNRKSETGNWKVHVGPKIEEKILENQHLCRDLVVSERSEFEVKIQKFRGREEVVNFKFGTCTCLEWQMTGIPCPHACCAIGDMDVYQFVAGWYKREVQESIYAEVMQDVPKIDIPHPNVVGIVCSSQMVENSSTSGNNVVLSPGPPQIKRRPGRPRKQGNEHNVVRVRLNRCSRCHGTGHSRRSCKEALKT